MPNKRKLDLTESEQENYESPLKLSVSPAKSSPNFFKFATPLQRTSPRLAGKKPELGNEVLAIVESKPEKLASSFVKPGSGPYHRFGGSRECAVFVDANSPMQPFKNRLARKQRKIKGSIEGAIAVGDKFLTPKKQHELSEAMRVSFSTPKNHGFIIITEREIADAALSPENQKIMQQALAIPRIKEIYENLIAHQIVDRNFTKATYVLSEDKTVGDHTLPAWFDKAKLTIANKEKISGTIVSTESISRQKAAIAEKNCGSSPKKIMGVSAKKFANHCGVKGAEFGSKSDMEWGHMMARIFNDYVVTNSSHLRNYIEHNTPIPAEAKYKVNSPENLTCITHAANSFDMLREALVIYLAVHYKTEVIVWREQKTLPNKQIGLKDNYSICLPKMNITLNIPSENLILERPSYSVLRHLICSVNCLIKEVSCQQKEKIARRLFAQDNSNVQDGASSSGGCWISPSYN